MSFIDVFPFVVSERFEYAFLMMSREYGLGTFSPITVPDLEVQYQALLALSQFDLR